MEPVLITIPISHFCEKARWALDRSGIAYEEQPHLQGFHFLALARAGAGSTTPVLVAEEGIIRESRDIVRYADRHLPAERSLYPAAMASEVAELEAGFDAGLGPDSRLWIYGALRDRPRALWDSAAARAPGWQHAAVPVAGRLMTRVIERYFSITPAARAAVVPALDATLDAVAARLADGRPYLAGERFTAADLTFAALAAPLVLPAEYSVALPPAEAFPRDAVALVHRWRAHPAGAHALRMFREERWAR